MGLYDAVRVVTNTVGTGNATLGAAAAGYVGFTDHGVTNGTSVDYVIEDGNNREIGTGTWVTGNILQRTTIVSTLVNGVFNKTTPTAISLSGSAYVMSIVTARNIGFASTTEPMNTFFAAPNGVAGIPSFRTIVAADVPTLNQNTTGTAGSAGTLITARNIDGQAFNGSADITVIAPGTHAAVSKATPVDADELPLIDSAATFTLKKFTWANLKATAKLYFDGLYANKDANNNVSANQFLQGSSYITTAGGTTVLTVASSYYQRFTGTLNQTVTLPDVTTLTLQTIYEIHNDSTGFITVQSSGLNTVFVLAPGTEASFSCISLTGATAASWEVDYTGTIVTSGKNFIVNNSVTLAGTDGTTITLPSSTSSLVPAGLATASGLTVTTGHLLGRNTAGTGAVEELTVSSGLKMTGTTLDITNSSYVTLLASETLAAGDLVNIYNNAGTANMQKANATTSAKPAHGFVLAPVTTGTSGIAYLAGINTAVTGQTPGRVFLSTSAGLATSTVPTTAGNIVQDIGIALSATSLHFHYNPPTILS